MAELPGNGHEERGTHRLRALLREHWLDIALAVVGLALGWMTLWFPFGRDQGLYHYVGREWVLHGSVPYRDVFDHKTPGLYMVHALAVALFGANMWGIRVLEMVGVLLTGLMAATFSVARGERIHPGVRGAAVLAAGVLFFGVLNWWDQSQSEIWYSLLGLCSVWSVRRIERTERAEFSAGAFSAMAVIMKPPAIWFAMIAGALVLLRVRERPEHRLRAATLGVLRYAAGGVAVAAPIFGYFAIMGAIPDMIEIVIHTNAYYAQHEASEQSFTDVARRTWDFVINVLPYINPLFVGGLALTTVVSLVRRNWRLCERHFVAIALAFAGVAATAMQRKFYMLHWTSLLGPASVIAALLAADCRDLLPWLRERRLAPLLFVAALLFCFRASDRSTQWWTVHQHVSSYVAGDISRHHFADFFKFPEINFWFLDSERAGRWLRKNSQPEDYIAVRGFQPEVYAVAQRSYPGRFFWTVYLTHHTRAEPERRARFQEEERKLFEQKPPRFVVALAGAGNGLDNPGYFLERGYQVREVVGQFVIMERGAR
jgi:hypothetical protein